MFCNTSHMGLVPTKPVFRVSDKVRFKPACSKLRYGTFQNTNNKGTDQTARMCRLVCACVVHKPPKTGFLVSRPISSRTSCPNCLPKETVCSGVRNRCPYKVSNKTVHIHSHECAQSDQSLWWTYLSSQIFLMFASQCDMA